MNNERVLANLTPALCMACFLFGSCIGHRTVPELQKALEKSNDRMAKYDDNLRSAFECGVIVGARREGTFIVETIQSGDYFMLTNQVPSERVLKSVYSDPMVPEWLKPKTKP